jgi:hypothetical protein
MNREQRRAAEKQADPKVEADAEQRKLVEHGTPPDVASERAKSQRHGKVTADKWNQ